MSAQQVLDDMNRRTVQITDYDLDTISKASIRLAKENTGMSEHELTAAPIVNGRSDMLSNSDFRQAFIRMGRS